MCKEYQVISQLSTEHKMKRHFTELVDTESAISTIDGKGQHVVYIVVACIHRSHFISDLCNFIHSEHVRGRREVGSLLGIGDGDDYSGGAAQLGGSPISGGDGKGVEAVSFLVVQDDGGGEDPGVAANREAAVWGGDGVG